MTIPLDKIRDLSIRDTNFKNSIKENIKIACDNNELEILFFFAQMLDDKFAFRSIISAVCKNYNSSLLMIVLEKYSGKIEMELILWKIFQTVCEKCDIPTLDWLVKNSDIKKYIDDETRNFIIKPLKTACINKRYTVVKWIIENCKDIHRFEFEFLFESINDEDFTILDILKSYNIDIKKSLNTALDEIFNSRQHSLSKHKLIVDKLIYYGADIDLKHVSMYLKIGQYDICKKLINENNYLEIFKQSCYGCFFSSQFEFVKWIYDTYNGKENTSKFFAFLTESDAIWPKTIIENIIEIIIENDRKFFVDLLFSRKSKKMHEILRSTDKSKLTGLQMMALLETNKINYTDFDPLQIDHMAIHIIYKKNLIHIFHILAHVYPNIYFEVDINGKLSNYGFHDNQVKSARKV